MIASKFMTAAEAVALISDGDTVGLIGGGGGLVEANYIFAAVEKRFLETAQPRNLTVVHALGIGDKKTRGLNCFAHEGMVKRVIGGHWVWSPTMQALARDEKIEAYVLPGGVISQLFREIGAGRPGLISHVGLGTFVDPRQDGGRMNKSVWPANGLSSPPAEAVSNMRTDVVPTATTRPPRLTTPAASRSSAKNTPTRSRS